MGERRKEEEERGRWRGCCCWRGARRWRRRCRGRPGRPRCPRCSGPPRGTTRRPRRPRPGSATAGSASRWPLSRTPSRWRRWTGRRCARPTRTATRASPIGLACRPLRRSSFRARRTGRPTRRTSTTPHGWTPSPRPTSTATYWEANSAYFDDPAWLDTFATANIDGDVLESGDLEARVELLEKTALDQVAANLVMGLIEAAADGKEGAWDAAAAVYTGCGTDNVHGAPRNALYDRSDRRGMHFGTIQNGETSLTNAEVMGAFQGGYSPENAAVGARAVQRTAWQSLLRYAHFLDGHFEFETDFLAHQAEGLAFWRILEATVAQEDPERSAAITAAFTSPEPEPLAPSNYCYIL